MILCGGIFPVFFYWGGGDVCVVTAMVSSMDPCLVVLARLFLLCVSVDVCVCCGIEKLWVDVPNPCLVVLARVLLCCGMNVVNGTL